MSKPINTKLKGGLDNGIYKELEQVRVNDDFEASSQLKTVVDTAPTYIPINHSEQEVYYVNGATYRKYIYINNNWKYITLS